jgi:Methylase involved in ubiquinone/menaquinone biosynthesis
MLYLCPKCQNELQLKDRNYCCINNHHYDVAKEGYVNLILANQKNSKLPGDSKESLQSRKKFLDTGYYQVLSDKVNEIVKGLTKPDSCILDAGCGTGYYLNRLVDSMKTSASFYGVDVGKEAVKMASKLNKKGSFAVCSVFHLPVKDECFDIVMSIFCPYSAEEFSRVTKKDGYVIAVTPGKRHLYEMKELVYENPYENAEEGYLLPDFNLVESVKVTTKIILKSNEDIVSLWKMTPYYHKTNQSANQKLFSCDKIETVIDFMVNVYKKK